MHRDMDAEQAGFRNSSLNGRVAAVRTAARDNGDMEMVKTYDGQFEHQQEKFFRVRRYRKELRTASRAYAESFENRDSRSDQ